MSGGPSSLFSAAAMVLAEFLGYTSSMTTIHAHYIGQVFVPDEPVDLVEGASVELSIRQRDRGPADAAAQLARLPLLRMSPDDAEAINRAPEFSVEES